MYELVSPRREYVIMVGIVKTSKADPLHIANCQSSGPPSLAPWPGKTDETDETYQLDDPVTI